MTEGDFDDPATSAVGDSGLVVDFLEPAAAAPPEGDTGTAGTDLVPYEYARAVTNRFCWDDDDPEAEHQAMLIDGDGVEILRVRANGACVTQLVEPGDYTLRIVHDARSAETLPVFVESTPGALPGRAADRPDGGRPAGTQDAAVDTFLRTKKCHNCVLDYVDLSDAILAGADLSGASFVEANLTGANLHRAELDGVDMRGAKLINANLSQAIMFIVALDGADLTGANLSGGEIEGVDFVGARLIGTNLRVRFLIGSKFRSATLRSIDLSGLDLTTNNFCLATFDSVDFTGSNLTGATWTTCKRCLPGSIGMCVL